MEYNSNELRNDIIHRLGTTAELVLKNTGSFDVVGTDKLQSILEAKNAGSHDTVVPKNMVFNASGGAQSGAAEIFKTHYNSIMKSDMEEVIGIFKVMSTSINCDIEVIKAFKAVSKTGITHDERLKTACGEIAYSITGLLSPSTSYITKTMVLDNLKFLEEKHKKDEELNEISYYLDVLIKSIRGVFN